ncbi:Phage integrase [Rhodopseudomonas palustris HaA2]|uniref:Phage integrase n=1 Tax=Rhodopseudomonas palustris (strain HaA2) TaxID=316058 RepID=Q2IUV8_RHOP2|nr:integrase family protein [Rhodopseudomonas palustris]ABD08002.1 Phage integrase [Rhodopseudomonas palustris HaA2]
MPSQPAPLTPFAIANAKPKPTRYEISDGGHAGLRVIVQPSGIKSFVFRYKRGTGEAAKNVRIMLGRAAGPGALTLRQAREAADSHRRLKLTGADPADQRRVERAANLARIRAEEIENRRKDDTVALVLERYFKSHVNGLLSARETKRILTRELSGWARRRIDHVSRADAVKLLEAIQERDKPILANRTRAHASKFFKWCIEKGLLEINPFEHTTRAAKEIARDRVLSDAELRILLLANDRLEWPWREYIAVLLMLGQRREEVAGMRWDALDLDCAEPVWLMAASRYKNGQPHAVPLPAAVVSILRSIGRMHFTEIIDGAPTLKESPFVFTTTGRTAISGFSKAKVQLTGIMHEIACGEAKARGESTATIEKIEWRLHDLRRTMATTMARLKINVVTIERVLGHKMQGVMAVYQRYDYLPEKLHALTVWNDHIARIVAPQQSNVVRMTVAG